MKKSVQYLLWALGIPLGVFLLSCVSGGSGFLVGAVLTLLFVVVYILVGLVLLLTGKRHELAKSLLLAGGIILLVGLSTCSIILANLRINPH